MGRKHCGKGEIACYEQFLLFPQCFQKACFPGASKGVIVWEWVKVIGSLTRSQTSPGFYLSAVQFKITKSRLDREKFSNRLENTVGKGEIARYQQFLLYPQCFQRTCTANM